MRPRPRSRCSWIIRRALFQCAVRRAHSRSPARFSPEPRTATSAPTPPPTAESYGISIPDAHQAGPSRSVPASLANGMLFLISGYRGILGGGSDNALLAFSVDGR